MLKLRERKTGTLMVSPIYHVEVITCGLVGFVAYLSYHYQKYFKETFTNLANQGLAVKTIACPSLTMHTGTLHRVPSKISEKALHVTGSTMLSQ